MKEDLISFETAKLAKEKGFDESCWWHYAQNKPEKESKLFRNEYEPEKSNIWNGRFSAPNQSFLQKWLRDKHNIFVWVSYNQYMDIKFNTHIKDLAQTNLFTVGYKETYEKAMEKVLFKGLQLIKTQ